MLRKLCVFVPLLVFTFSAFGQESRHFTFHYGFTVKNVPAGKKVRVWIPFAQTDAFQEVKLVSFKGDVPLKQTRELRYGNEIFFGETDKPGAPELHFDVEYDVLRHERVALNPAPNVRTAALNGKQRREKLQSDQPGLIDPIAPAIPHIATPGKNKPTAKAPAPSPTR